LKTLKLRREVADVIFLTEVVKGNICSPQILNNININSNNRLRNTNLFTLSFHRTNYGNYEPIHRMLLMGNKYYVLEKKHKFVGTILEEDRRGKHCKHKKVDDKIKEEIRQHIASIPKIESHYTRANTSKYFRKKIKDASFI